MNIVGYNPKRDGWFNRRYWHIAKGAEWVVKETDAYKKLISLDTLDKLTAFMKSCVYKSDPLRGIIHWIADPVTMVHRMKGDCDDFAWLWYDRLKAMKYEAHIYVCYRRAWWTAWLHVPWHFVVVWKEFVETHRGKPGIRVGYSAWRVASNTYADALPDGIAIPSLQKDAINAYRDQYKYSRVRRLRKREITVCTMRKE